MRNQYPQNGNRQVRNVKQWFDNEQLHNNNNNNNKHRSHYIVALLEESRIHYIEIWHTVLKLKIPHSKQRITKNIVRKQTPNEEEEKPITKNMK